MQTVSRVFSAPIVSASIAYGIGRYAASSHIMGALLACTVIVNARWIHSRVFHHVVSHDARIKLALEDASRLGKEILVMGAIGACIIDLPVYETVKMLAISAFLLICMIEYSRISTKAKNLDLLRNDFQPAAERMILEIPSLKANPLEKEYHLKFLKSVKPTIDRLLLLEEREGYETYTKLWNEMGVTSRWMLSHGAFK